jgi:hypothetical protein
VSRALLLLLALVALPACSDASAGGFPWARRPSGGGGGGGGASSIISHGYATYDSGTGTTPSITISGQSGDKVVLLFWDYLITNNPSGGSIIVDNLGSSYSLTRLESVVYWGFYAWADITGSVTSVQVDNVSGAYSNRWDVVAIVLRGAKTGAPGWTAHAYGGSSTIDPGALTTSGGNARYFMFGAQSGGTWASSSGGTVVETATARGNIHCLTDRGAAGTYQLSETTTGGSLGAAIAAAWEEQ